MRAKAAHLDELRKSIAVESDDDATRSSSGGGSSQAAAANRHQQQIDLSVLRKPILTAVTGFLEAHKAYEAGTDEIRKLLTSECDVLYECRVCRNLFRSLTNFISHKRVYCRKLFNVAQHFHFQNDGFLDQDLSTILQAEQDSQRKAKKVHADILNKDLSSIIERLRRKQHKLSADLSLTDYYDRVNHKLTQDDLNRQQHLLQLDRVPNSTAAVYQTVRGLSTASGEGGAIADSMSAQVGELDRLVDRRKETVLGPDGKVLLNTRTKPPPASALPVICDRSNRYFQPIDGGRGKPAGSHSCQECNLQFDTDQTLKLHMEMKHTPSTYVYTCPSCSKTFLQPAAVIRHLSNDHKKSMRRIKMMRDSIFKRRTRVDEVVVKGPSREVSRLLNASASSSNGHSSSSSSFGNGGNSSTANGSMNADEEAATRAWMENLEHFDQGPMCSYCGKTFDRKAVLATHMQTCVQKIRQTENGAGSVPPSSTSATGRRSRVKDEQLPPPPPPPPAVKIKQEVVDPVASSDDSNSYDVPLATLQARISGDSSGTVVTVKPEELGAGEESRSRRKRQKPTIMLRNANDDISWEDPVEEDVQEVVQIKQEPMEVEPEEESTPAAKAKRGPRSRKKKPDEPEVGDKELAERIEADGEIVCRCAKKYNDPERYKHHLRVFHSRQRRFWCAICDFKGYRKVDTINHLMQEHGYKGDAEDIGSLINFQPPEEKLKKKPAQSQPTSTLPAPPPVQSIISSVIDAVTRRNCDTSATDISLLESTVESVTLDSSSISDFGATLPRKRGRPRGLRDSIGSLPPPSEESGKKVKVEAVLEEPPPSPTAKRPIRNRVKPVDKDFVYDLTHLLHKEEDLEDFPLPELVQEKPVVVLAQPATPAVATVPTFGRSRSESSRNSTSSSSANTTPEKREPTTPSKKESLRSHAPKPKPSLDPSLFRGAALAMAKRQVEAGLAAFHRPPSIPHERPFFPSRMSPPKQLQPVVVRQFSPVRRPPGQQTLHDWPVVKKERRIGSIVKNASDIQIKRKYLKRAAANLPALIREQRKAIPRRNSVVPLAQRLSATVEILNKLNASRSAGADGLVPEPAPAMGRIPTAAEFRRYIEANLSDHRAAMAQVNLNGTTVEDLSGERGEVSVEKVKKEVEEGVVGKEEAMVSPRKRITMLQRMEDNRTKRMQELNGSPPVLKTQQQPTSAATSSSASSSSANPAGSSSTSTPTNVADMLHAKLKRFSSM
uniref:C2H2-type domain-containing protein n=1 Tax=Culex tarsalis TaxID=7177 RepID=A0A1Q3EZK1_CULTA